LFTRSIRSAALAVFTLLIAVTAAHAAPFTVLAPRNFVRTNGAPQTESASFTASNTAIPYTLRLRNGGAANQFSPVTSAVVALNGVQIFGPSDFNGQTPATVDRPVTLAATNQLTVEVRGSPGSGFTLSVLGEDNAAPLIEGTITPAPNLEFWNNGPVTVTFTCSDELSGISACSAPVTVTAEGSRLVTGTATDRAGNIATANVPVNIDKTPGTLTIVSPTAPIVNTAALEIVGTLTDALSGAGDIQCNGMPGARGAEQNDTTIRCRITVSAGPQTVDIRATDRAGNVTQTTLSVFVDLAKPILVVESPRSGDRTNVATIEVTGTVEDDDQLARVTVADVIASVANGRFTATVPLTTGANPIVVSAFDRAGNVASTTLDITRFSLPEVAITSPEDLKTVRDAAVTVSGTVSDAVSVTVNGVTAGISGGRFTADGIPLAQGRTVVTATATSEDGTVASASVFVYRDAIPPRVVLRAPLDGTVLFSPSVHVSGMIDDIVVGTVNSDQATVTVNGVSAEVANRGFVAANVPLVPGANVLRIVARDQGGNTTTLTANVTYDAAARAKISVLSGNNQSADIRTLLPLPLVVKLTNADGSPAGNRPVTFEVVENNGKLSANGTDGTIISIQTDAGGLAQAAWFLGGHAGAGNNRVRASAPGFSGAAEFQATAGVGPPRLIVVDAGNAQYGAFGAPLPRPIIVAVVDEGSNRLPDVPVTFTVAGGGGKIDGEQSVVVRTDGDGRAWVTPSLGQEMLNTFTAAISGSSAKVTFQAFGKLAGPAGETRISGVILDNTDLPIPGVTVRIDGSTLVAQADDAGQFSIQGAPVGYVKLLIDGSTAQRPGTWPTLEYAMFTIPGANNTIEMPIFLLPIDTRRGLFTDEVTGGTLTLPELPGFSLTVKPGSATFPGGGRTGTVSVTLVHADKMPMTPGFGQQPRFIVTIQPPGVHFDPPAAITFPNVDGYAPGEVTEMYSFDHDLGQFVSIGTATVSGDGGTLVSDPGVGIIKGGWHCGGNPASSGTAATCPECQKCVDGSCAPNDGGGCDDKDVCTVNDKCTGGACKGTPVPPETLETVTRSLNLDKVMKPLFEVTSALGMPGSFALQTSVTVGGLKECCNRLGGQKVTNMYATISGSIGATWEGPTPLSFTAGPLGQVGIFGVVGVSGSVSGSAKEDKCNGKPTGSLAVTGTFTFGGKLYLIKLPKDVLNISGGVSSGGSVGYQGTWDGSNFDGTWIFGHNGVTASASIVFANGLIEWTGTHTLIEPQSFSSAFLVPFTM
jgi:hypothetical protein